MDGHEHDTLSDDAFAGDIEAVLAVDPSPEFQARLRARVADEGFGTGWTGSWVWASLAAVAVTLVAVAMFGGSQAAPATVPLAVIQPLPVRELAEAMPAAVPMLAAGGAMPRGRSLSRRRNPAPDIVVSRDEARALTILVDAISDGRVRDEILPPLDTVHMPLTPIEELVLEPIALSPLVRRDSGELGSAEGVRQ